MIDTASLARLALFVDLPGPQLQAVAEMMEEESFAKGAKVVRTGISGSGFYVITDGEAAVMVNGQDLLTHLRAGDFFGELSILTGEAVVADVVAVSYELRCAVLPDHQLRPLLLDYPQITLRMLEAMSRRLRGTTTLLSG
jgi:CRP/FNR family transcriptional regulator, cyclic AMP receptor protein